MRKIYFIILLNIIFIFHVDAASISTSISCPNTVYKDDSFTCTIGSSVIDANLSGIKGNYVITNGSYVSFTPSSSFVAYASNEQGFVITPFGSDMSKVSIIFQLYNSNSEFLRNKWRETAKQRSLFVHRVCLLCC